MPTREDVRQQMREDKIESLLAQFVDITGSPKVKMVPVSHFDDVLDDGAGFAGAALPLGRPSRLNLRRYPVIRPARHSFGRMPRRSRNALSCMLAP